MRGMAMKKRVFSVFGLFALATFVASATACVFESGGDYKGGGRNSPVKKEENAGTTPTVPPTTATTPTTPTTPTPPPPTPDASTG
jgi:hypothetical protein